MKSRLIINSKFFITGLPRTRTYWFSEYLSGYEGVHCYHEALHTCTELSQFYSMMEGEEITGNSDCGLYLSDYREKYPEAPVVTIQRDPDEAYQSTKRFLESLQIPCCTREEFQVMHSALPTDGLQVKYTEIDDKLPEIHEYLGVPINKSYAEKMKRQKLVIPNFKLNVENYLL